ncbi:NCS2 family permease [Leptospira langatensis]|uniref:NCS2 family permease n=1 Tax=Leptospira langatensis TaxID=2484983 RepID=A0A5F1ZQN4_9LEPT|nr:NCS2 family permease [Leptospira langatensis]TGK01851.1 NCS2 family permease [Leptospira langatensis]TGL39456.1 NCS2 family permease [Leptospira langatensis]
MSKYKWFVAGDLDGFFGLMIDNLIQILVLVGLCIGLCGMPQEFVFSVVIPGAAISLLVGNVFYAWQAARLAHSENRSDVTALPYGINTVSLFAFVFFVMFPVYQKTNSYKAAWSIGLLASFISGLIEFLGAFVAEKIRKATPRAALLSALAGIALTFISMDFLVRTFLNPLVAFIPFGIILLQYFGKVVFPFKIPGGLISVIAGTLLAWYSPYFSGRTLMDADALRSSWNIGLYLPIWSGGELFSAWGHADIREYLSIILPMGIFNVIGSLQNIESAEAAGDKFNTRNSLMVNGLGTMVGSLFGSPFPTTIYIGHPGWKALGARAGYSSLNGVFMTLVAFLGLIGFVSKLIPVEAGMAIVLWIGIVIGAQAFEATPTRHAPAVVIGLLPALAGWGVLLIQSAFNYADPILSKAIEGTTAASMTPNIWLSSVPLDQPIFPYSLAGLLSLSQGFLLSAMVWASIATFVIDRDFKKAIIASLAGVLLAATGFIHAYALRGNAIITPFELNFGPFVQGYLLLAGLFLLASFLKKEPRSV